MGKSANMASWHRGGGGTAGLQTQASAPNNSAPATRLLALPPTRGTQVPLCPSHTLSAQNKVTVLS